MERALTNLRIRILKSYGFEIRLKGIRERSAREAILAEIAREWAREFDANSLVTLRRAMAHFDIEGDFRKIRARLLYILADTDEWFPASIGRSVMAKLSSAAVDATFFELKSEHGHYATTEEPEKWVPEAKRFLSQLQPAPRRGLRS